MYRRPDELGEALEVLATRRPAVVAGGTDVFASVPGPAAAELLDVSAIDGLRGVREDAGSWRIGAATRWTDLVRGPTPAALDALVQAASDVGGPQVQNRGTIGGNLCNASPAADGVPPLLALDAQLEIASVRGVRRLPLADFVLGPRRTALAADELLVAVHVPRRAASTRSAFAKHGHRRYLVISVAMVAVAIDVDDRHRVLRAGVAVGACGPVARRLAALEARLVGAPLSRLAALAAAALHGPARDAMLAPLSPIDDVRGTARHRLDAAAALATRLLAELGR